MQVSKPSSKDNHRKSSLCYVADSQESGSVDVHWTTHKPRGLSQKDMMMAEYCEQQAGLIGTVDPSEAQKCIPPKESSK